VSPAERKLTLSDLLTKGLIVPGAKLEATWKSGGPVTAKVGADGQIELAGSTYKTPSEAGAAAKETMEGHSLSASQRATDGWYFWQTKDATGALVRLKELRRRAAEGNAGG
jgi:hypothetical protein